MQVASVDAVALLKAADGHIRPRDGDIGTIQTAAALMLLDDTRLSVLSG